MVFTSYEFLLVFLPIAFAGYWLLCAAKQAKLARVWLIAASLFFYGWGSLRFLPLFLLTIAINYLVGVQLTKNAKTKTGKKWLIFSLIWNIGLLCFYKYLNFGIYSANRLFSLQLPSLNIILPLGISFFTFSIISFLVDSYEGKIKELNLTDYLLFITFFPKLMIGPITGYSDIVSQFSAPDAYTFNFTNFRKGVFMLSFGCAKKIWIANSLLFFSQYTFSNITASPPLELFFGLFANLFAIYFDFSGYTDMAVGLGLLYNITLPENFNMPYRARNIQDFWKRWHMTLSGFLNKYVFSRIYSPAKGLFSFCLASMVTFSISGLWHGAGYTFLLWGLLHGAGMCLVGTIAVHYPKKHLLPKKIAQISTFLFLVFAAALYSSANMGGFISLLKGLCNIGYYLNGGPSAVLTGIKMFFMDNSFVLLMLAAGAFITFFAKPTKEYAAKCLDNPRYIILTSALLVLSVLKMGGTSTFLYFAF